MRVTPTKSLAVGMWALLLNLPAVSVLSGQARIVLPEGSVIMV